MNVEGKYESGLCNSGAERCVVYYYQEAGSQFVCLRLNFFSEETKVDKKIGFFKGLKETWGYKPYFYLLMLELFSWLSLQVSP